MIFVTGGTGLLGSHVLIELAKGEEPIRAIYRSDKKRKQLSALFKYYLGQSWKGYLDRIEWCKGDILDIPFLQESMKGCSEVYHCAGIVSFHRKDFNKLINVNRNGTANIVNIALQEGVSKLCHVSSTAAIGGNSENEISEAYKWKKTPTTSGYSISKYSAEKEVWRGIEEGLNAVIVNPCVILGAGNWNRSSLTLLRTLKRGMSYYPPGSNAIVDARDVTEIMLRLMRSEIQNERFLCIGSNQSFKELMDEVALQLNVAPPRRKANRSLVEFARRYVSLLSLFTRKRPSITKETVQSLFEKRCYSNYKVSNALNFEFREMAEIVRNSIEGKIN